MLRRPVLTAAGVIAATLMLAACGGTAATGAAPAALAGQTPVSGIQPVEEAAAVSTEEAAPQEAPAVETSGYVILPDQSEVRFIIHEILLGAPKEVIGATNGVSGSISVDYANPTAVSMSPIVIDMTGLATDDNRRTQTLHRSILQTGTYPTAEFVATGFSGLPASVTIGQPFDFQITGDLTIHGTTKQVTFDATVTPVSETRLEGTASYSTTYQEFGVQILRLPEQVASVEDAVILQIDFAAEK
jgi:polyisoprenoid-binding protein YceI